MTDKMETLYETLSINSLVGMTLKDIKTDENNNTVFVTREGYEFTFKGKPVLESIYRYKTSAYSSQLTTFETYDLSESMGVE